MFNNVAIDVFIGLIAVYLLYSLLASIIMEVLAKYLALRARITLKAISKLLDDSEFTDDNLICRYMQSAQGGKFFNPLKGRPFTALFYSHPNIKNLGRNNFERKPADISPEMFSITLIQLLRGDKFTEGENTLKYLKDNIIKDTKATDANATVGKDKGPNATVVKDIIELPVWYQAKENKLKPNVISKEIVINPLTIYQLKQMLMDAGEDVDLFRKALQNWFNEMMNRANGWYIKQTRGILFLVGLVIAFAFNVDTIFIAKRLSTDKSARDGMIQFAGKLNDASPKPGDSTSAQKAAEKAFTVAKENMDDAQLIFSTGERTRGNVPGWIITAIAISLGAPFWFDILGKFMSIAQVGKTSSTKKTDLNNDEPVA